MKYLVVIVLFLFFSCKSLMYNDRAIIYWYVGEEKLYKDTRGDYFELFLTSNDLLRVQPAYFREYGRLQNPLIVRINIDKKFSFKNFGTVTSKEFGDLKPIDHEWLKENNKHDAFLFAIDLKGVEVEERHNRILKDTLTIQMGQLEFKFAPK